MHENHSLLRGWKVINQNGYKGIAKAGHGIRALYEGYADVRFR